MSSSVAIIVLNYNGRDMLEKYLPSVLDLNYNEYDIYVFDNASSDNSVSYIRDNLEDITVISSEENLGFSKGNNCAVTNIGSYDYYWFLNNDVRVSSDALDILVSYIDNHNDCKIVGPQINESFPLNEIQSIGFRYDIFGHIWPVKSPSTDPFEVSFVSGAAILVDAGFWSEVGGFFDKHFLFGDDTYLCFRSWIQGYPVRAVPHAVVYHDHGGTHGSNPEIEYHNAKSKLNIHLLMLERKLLAITLPGYLVRFTGRLLIDIYNRNLNNLSYRLMGFISSVIYSRELISERKRIQSERSSSDWCYLCRPKLSKYFPL